MCFVSYSSLCEQDKRMDYEEGSYVSSAGSGVLDFTCYEDLMGKTSPMELSVIPNADEQQQEVGVCL